MTSLNLHELAKYGLRGETELYDVYGKRRRAKKINNALSEVSNKHEDKTISRSCKEPKVR